MSESLAELAKSRGEREKRPGPVSGLAILEDCKMWLLRAQLLESAS